VSPSKSKFVKQAERRRKDAERMARWRNLNPGRAKLLAIGKTNDEKRLATIKRFADGHVHICSIKKCGKEYRCKNQCIPTELTNSICQECFEGL
jgi:hypothetical protein